MADEKENLPEIPPIQKGVNYAKYRDSGNDPFTVVWDELDGDSFLSKIEALIKAFSPTGQLSDDYRTLIAAYTVTPSALSHVLPILHLQGASGCGKSSVLAVIDRLRGGNNCLNGGTATYASVRNIIDSKRFGGGFEKNCIIMLDDIKSEKFLRDDAIYSFMRSGYDRSTDKAVRAGTEPGSTIEFHTFSAKVLTSTELIINHRELTELARRTLVVPFVKRGQEIGLLELSDYVWDGCNLVDDFWKKHDNIELFVNNRKRAKRILTPLLSPQQKAISIDICAAMMTCSTMSTADIKAFWERIHKQQTQLLSENSSPVKQLVSEFCKGMLDCGIVAISIPDVKAFAKENGVGVDEVGVFLVELNWKLGVNKNNGKLSWIFQSDEKANEKTQQ